MQRIRFIFLATSLLVVSNAFPMKLVKNSLKKSQTKFSKKAFNDVLKRNIVIATTCLFNQQKNSKAVLLFDKHESLEEEESLRVLTNSHTLQMLYLMNEIKNKRDSSLFLEFSDHSKKNMDMVQPLYDQNLITRVRHYAHNNTIPYINFDNRKIIESTINALLSLREENKFIKPLLIPSAYHHSLDAYLIRLQEKKKETVLTVDASNAPAPLKTALIKQAFELEQSITSCIEFIADDNNLPKNPTLIDAINNLREYGDDLYVKTAYKIITEQGLHPDVNLFTKILEKKNHLSIAFGGALHCAKVEECLKLSGFDIIDQQQNALILDLENYRAQTCEYEDIPQLFLNNKIFSFIK